MSEDRIQCLIHGLSCLRCGVAADLEEDLLLEKLSRRDATIAGLVKALEGCVFEFESEKYGSGYPALMKAKEALAQAQKEVGK